MKTEKKDTKQKQTKYLHSLRQKGGIYFYCGAIINRKNVFVTNEYIDLLVNAFKLTELKKDVKNLGYVVMPNFFYWVFKLGENQDDPVKIYSELKRDVAIGILNNLKMEVNDGAFEIVDEFKGNERVGRSSAQKILWTFEEQAKKFEKNKRYRVWTPKTEIRLLDTPELLQDKIEKMKKAPLSERWQMVKNSEDYPYLYLAEDVAELDSDSLQQYSMELVSSIQYTTT